MTVALANLDVVALVIALWIFVALLTSPFIGKFLRGPQPDFDSDHPHRPRVGSLEQYEAERRERVERALRRHEDNDRERRAA